MYETFLFFHFIPFAVLADARHNQLINRNALTYVKNQNVHVIIYDLVEEK
uniref:Uncharacterized protein n=1 Tax=Loa loa TaxID=7209 RepID=A0A1I7VND0_LOALO